MGYRQLTQKQRYQIFAYLEIGASQRQITRELGIHSSTVSREARRLHDEWSPEQISEFMANADSIRVSHEWIYSLIRDDKARGGKLWNAPRLPQRRCYRRQLAQRAGLGKIPQRVGIEHRPADVENRLHIGHWEGDTVLKGHKESAW